MRITTRTALLAVLALSFAAGCQTNGHRASLADAGLSRAQLDFWRNLEALCGQAFEGRVVEDTTDSPDFAGKAMVMHVRACEEGRILVPFHVGEDRSRTWVFTKTDTGLRLKHDHRHEDGSEDEITQYGGDTANPGTSRRQEFHADALTASLIPAAITNVWTVEIVPGRTYTYALRREGTDRRFRVEFDLTNPITPPPAPWGHE